jgi:DNA-binding Xre family transcriptional regulator
MMRLTASWDLHSDAASFGLNPRGTISKALGELKAEGGPDLDIPALADQVEVPTDWLYRFERGQIDALDLTALEQLCCILGRSPNDLLGYEADL